MLKYWNQKYGYAQLSGDKMNEPICKHCNTPMQNDGIALIPNFSGIPDFADGCVVTVSPDGTARQIECFKCHKCGYSISKGKNNE